MVSLGVLYMIKNLLISNEGLNNGKLHKLSRGIATGAIIVTLTMIPGCSFSADALTNPNDVVAPGRDTAHSYPNGPSTSAC